MADLAMGFFLSLSMSSTDRGICAGQTVIRAMLITDCNQVHSFCTY